jgi:hypothetical protein
MNAFYPLLFEEANNQLTTIKEGSIRNEIDLILQKDPQYKGNYVKNTTLGRIMNAGRVSDTVFQTDFTSAVYKLEDEHNISIKSLDTKIIPAKGKPSPGFFKEKHYSSNSATIEFTIVGESQDKKKVPHLIERTWSSFLILKTASPKGKKSSSTSTNFKESLVNYFLKSKKTYAPLISGGEVSIKNELYTKTIYDIIEEISQDSIEGVDDFDVTEILKFLHHETTYNNKILRHINGAMSIAAALKQTQFSNWEVRRDEFFRDLKSDVANSLGFTGHEIDKWNPMDIMLIRPNSESEIRLKIKEALAEENEDLKIGKINSLFVNALDSEDDEPVIFAVSLKMDPAQAGKATSYLNKDLPDNVELTKGQIEKTLASDLGEFKMSDEENEWPKAKVLKEIINQREKVKDQISGKLDEFNYKVDDIKGFNKNKNVKSEYGALKLFNHILKRAELEKNLFTNIVQYGLSLTKNPTFFKYVGSGKGSVEDVIKHIEIYPPSSGLELIDKRTGEPGGKIFVRDSNDFAGLEVIYDLKFVGKIYECKLSIRTNQGDKAKIQVMVEINRWTKEEDLNETLFFPLLFN